ncbi:glyoxalase/bleomycin resistance protein/dioxygenase [Natrialba hulunbeirensis JCM 10989]|uniref:Glyoxalase/bleomycin resistance protein/dioxygenase n=1 Tax=Natrialba hulunbeirensis JCM 10989 TaxID=1227493 RepID=M0A420_9EURY|nr:VOC family protein [Natrialba hulunbeirensis]ELY93339.1 glyoxalase/bleomycin resistance protein/dioxygenase [Natrialba hulunbeirensis JCM 10989]
MLTGLSWLALEVKSLESAREFYTDVLELSVRRASNDERHGADEVDHENERALAAGDTDLILRRPDGVPRGGLHTHYAFSIPEAEYDDWWDRLEAVGYDLDEAQFGPVRSLYLYDPDGNCVELGQQDVAGPGIDGIFEVVLEVESLERAESFYSDLGFETVDVGDDRKRVRMNGPMALELWEPHLGIADARGGVHVDLGFETDEPTAALGAVAEQVQQVDEESAERVVVRDPDGHVLTFVSSSA